MPRIEIELTSTRPDGTWTWRAAGARQPKGVLDGSVLPGGAKVGDVLRAEADVDIDGITVLSTQRVSQKKTESERIEIIGSGREEPPVTTNMRGDGGGDRSERGRRGDRDHDRGRDRPGFVGRGSGGPGGAGGPSRPGGSRPDQSRRPDGSGGPRPADRGDRARRDGRPGEPGRPPHDRPSGDRPSGDRPSGDRPSGDRPSGDRPSGDGPSGGRPAADRPPADRPRANRPAGDRVAGDGRSDGRPPGDRRPGDRRTDRQPSERRSADRPTGDRGGRPSGDRPIGDRGERPARGASRPAEPPRPRARRLQPGRAFRDAVLAELSPERKAVAEQILRGGIPAVRQAVEEQNAKAREVGGPEIKADALLAVAEELLPALRAAEWRDRAEAAVGIIDEISVRDLRAVVSGSDTARDEDGRALAARLREALDRRAAADRQSWVDEITSSLDEGRVVRALRISGRPPEPGSRFPAELAKRLSDAGGEALAPDTTPDRWAAVLEAVVASPVRRTITPRGLPAEPGEVLSHALRQAAPRVPAIAALLGVVPGSPPRRPPKPAGHSGPPAPGGPPGRPPGRPATPPPGRPAPSPAPRQVPSAPDSSTPDAAAAGGEAEPVAPRPDRAGTVARSAWSAPGLEAPELDSASHVSESAPPAPDSPPPAPPSPAPAAAAPDPSTADSPPPAGNDAAPPVPPETESEGRTAWQAPALAESDAESTPIGLMSADEAASPFGSDDGPARRPDANGTEPGAGRGLGSSTADGPPDEAPESRSPAMAPPVPPGAPEETGAGVSGADRPGTPVETSPEGHDPQARGDVLVDGPDAAAGPA